MYGNMHRDPLAFDDEHKVIKGNEKNMKLIVEKRILI